MTQHWSPPPLQPFDRLQVTDGLLMNAERWRLAHQYHRQHHRFQYQSIQEPGIVYGLGVRIIDPPPDVRKQYQDRRWLEVQPGLAIDYQGNFIVVTESISFRLASINYQTEPLTVYLVIRHVDPDTLRQKPDTATLRESFRLDEKMTPPHTRDVELCRLVLPPHDPEQSQITLKAAADVFAPTQCELNFLGRLTVRSRPHGFIHVGIERDSHPADGSNPFGPLLDAIAHTHPQLRGRAVSTPITPDPDRPPDCELLYVALTANQETDDFTLGAWRAYLEIGGTLFFELQGTSNEINEQLTVYRELQQAIVEAANDPELGPVRAELASEFQAIQNQLVERLLEEYGALQELSTQFKSPLQPLLGPSHPLRCQPFRFDLLPIVEGLPTFIAIGVGWIVSLGQLSSAWNPDRPYPLSQPTIRATQELGLNLLHFAWRRKQLTACQQAETPSATVQEVMPKPTATVEV